MQTPSPLIEVIIPVHDARRPLQRAVRSVLGDCDDRRIAVRVVAHNIDAETVEGMLGELAGDERLIVMPFEDGIASPSGPRNAGVRATTADYFTFVDSDDELAQGTAAAWLSEVDALRPDVHVGRLFGPSGQEIPAPLARTGRTTGLDPVRDLLDYRTSPVGAVIATRLRGAGWPGFTEGVRVGEDMEAGVFLWNVPERITRSDAAGGYRIHSDAEGRVTGDRLPAAILLGPILRLLELPWFRELPESRRRSAAVKFLRVQILGHYDRLAAEEGLSDEDLAGIAPVVRALLDAAPGVSGLLSRADAAASEAIAAGRSAESRALLAARGRGATPLLSRVLPRSPRFLFHPDSLLSRTLRSRARGRRAGK
ncbi:glycosyltransferase family 2 protein [Leucobacter sp. CSA2]|uniref:Glycosyltransferase family 2 protein n=1 Tax=Leucobacter edaphi TaxID=2796472 RepID=A0A934QEH0_9MICO|nr:glycosyltransferase family A protein [Leucobacter edaphi]MBK0421627.1 glycosyltransferase family 2 protein [Leucobacter edaphi]